MRQEDGRIIAAVGSTGLQGGAITRWLDVIMADAMRFGPDGKVVEFWTLSNDQKAVDAFIG